MSVLMQSGKEGPTGKTSGEMVGSPTTATLKATATKNNPKQRTIKRRRTTTTLQSNVGSAKRQDTHK